MAVKPIFDIATRAFNKAGARLLRKDVAVKLEEQVFDMGGELISMGKKVFHGVTPPKGAVTGSFIQGETHFGQQGFSIVSFFDDSGKLLERSRFNNIQGKVDELASYSTYNRSNLIGSSSGTADVTGYLRKTNFFKDKKILKTEDFNVIIDNRADLPIITRSILTNYKGKGNIWYEQAGRDKSLAGTKHLTDRYDVSIAQFGKGTSRKSFITSYDYSPNGHFYIDSLGGRTKAEGLSKEQIRKLQEDQYLPVRLMSDSKQQCEALKRDIFENTGISQKTSVEYYYAPQSNTGGKAGHQEISINLGRNLGLDSLFNRMSHESRHVWQYELIDMLKQGKIQDPKLKKLAEELKYAFEHKPKDYSSHGESYYNCFFEKDAYAWGDIYKKRFYSNEANLYKIFDLSKASYYLG